MIIRFDGNKAATNQLDFLRNYAGNFLTSCLALGLHRAPFVQNQERAMSTENRIREKLMIGLRPTRLDVVNESDLHAGHASSPGTGESNFRVLVVSDAFAGKARVARHRIVNDLLKDELSGAVHALALLALAPGEPLPAPKPADG
jgi:BolA protein